MRQREDHVEIAHWRDLGLAQGHPVVARLREWFGFGSGRLRTEPLDKPADGDVLVCCSGRAATLSSICVNNRKGIVFVAQLGTAAVMTGRGGKPGGVPRLHELS